MYADATYYAGDFGGSVIPAETQDAALEAAADLIDDATLNRIVSIGINNLTDYQIGNIKTANCLIAEDLYSGGHLDSGDAVALDFSIGDLTVKQDPKQSKLGGIPVRSRAMSLLSKTGLMYSGVV